MSGLYNNYQASIWILTLLIDFRVVSEHTLDLSFTSIIERAGLFPCCKVICALQPHTHATPLPEGMEAAAVSFSMYSASGARVVSQIPVRHSKRMTYYNKQQSCKPRRRIVTSATLLQIYNSLWQMSETEHVYFSRAVTTSCTTHLRGHQTPQPTAVSDFLRRAWLHH